MTAAEAVGRQKLLVADDQDFIRSLVRITLESANFDLLEAGDGVSALTLAREQRPDLIFLDWSMPGLSGIEVCRELRADPGMAETKIVLLTAHVEEEDRAAGFEAGADDYITKPFSPRQLLEKVTEVLGPGALIR